MIAMSYQPEGLTEGWVISAGAVILLIGLETGSWFWRRRKREWEENEEEYQEDEDSQADIEDDREDRGGLAVDETDVEDKDCQIEEENGFDEKGKTGEKHIDNNKQQGACEQL